MTANANSDLIDRQTNHTIFETCQNNNVDVNTCKVYGSRGTQRQLETTLRGKTYQLVVILISNVSNYHSWIENFKTT